MSSAERLAVLNDQTYNNLSKVSCHELIRYEGFAKASLLRERLAEFAKKSSKQVRMKFDLHLFAHAELADEVAESLARYGFFLQHPLFDASPVPYSNPQYLHIEVSAERQGLVNGPGGAERASREGSPAIDEDHDIPTGFKVTR